MGTLGIKVKERLFSFIKYKGMSNLAFEKASGLSNGYLRNFKGNLGGDKLTGILSAFPELNQDWLLYGEGSMLVDSPAPVLESAAPALNLSNVELLLREMLAEKEVRIDALNEIIWELKAENAMLKEQIKYKGAHAEGAAGSFAADAV